MKKVLVVSGTRSEYGLVKPVMEAINKSKSMKLQTVVTGSHLSKVFGSSVKEILKDRFKINAKVKLPLSDDTNEGMSKLLGKAVGKFTKVFRKLKPDIVLILGDRVEVFGAALACFYMNIPVAQMHAGDRSVGGHLDDSARHAISKLSSLNFAATKKSYDRLIKMGEEKSRVFHVGAPGLDSIMNRKYLEKKDLFEKLGLEDRETILILFHPVTTEVKGSIRAIESIMSAVNELDKQAAVIFPNADAGGRRMIKVIKRFAKGNKNIKTFKNIDHGDFMNMMKYVSIMIGNSSSGIIEAPSFKLPVINVGKRQEGRERACNVIDAGYNKKDILKSVKKALYDKKFLMKVKKCRNPYGDDKTGEKVAKILTGMKFDKRLLQKQITY